MQPNNGHEESLEPLSLVESLKCQGLQKRPSGGMRSTKYPSATPTSILLPHLPICLFNYYNITVGFFSRIVTIHHSGSLLKWIFLRCFYSQVELSTFDSYSYCAMLRTKGINVLSKTCSQDYNSGLFSFFKCEHHCV